MQSRRTAFTLLEIMIVVAIIALLAMIAMPSYMRARRTSQNARFINDLRIATGAFEMYHGDTGQWPADAGPGQLPAVMANYLPSFAWTARTPIGGRWDWDNGVLGFSAGVSVDIPFADQAMMTEIDERLDNGDLNSGGFRKTTGTIYSCILQQ